MKVLITGASGLLGRALARRYLERDLELWCWRHRHPLPEDLSGRVRTVRHPDDLEGHFDWVVNLAGANLAAGPWTRGRRRVLYDSRVDFTRALLAGVRRGRYSIDHLITGSAIGFYGNRQEPVTEAAEAGRGFAADLVADWEDAALACTDVIPTITRVRTGLVLSRRGGLLGPLSLSARFGLASRLGSGRQGQSWVHEQDWLNAIDWIRERRLAGAVNLTAPHPVDQDSFSRTLARTLRRPYVLRVPAAPLRLVLGELATLVLDGQYVLPRRLGDSGFRFRFDTLDTALSDLFDRPG